MEGCWLRLVRALVLLELTFTLLAGTIVGLSCAIIAGLFLVQR